MPDILILGPGCPKCQILYARVEQAAQELGLDCAIEKVSDLDRIIEFGVMSTPALVVGGTIKMSGHVPSVAQLKEMLT